MPYNEILADRIRNILKDNPNISEKKMFGGLAFMLNGNMCCGIVKNELMARVGAENYESALAQPHARQMDFTGKSLKGFVYVAADGIESEEGLKSWVQRAIDFVMTLPTK